MKAGLTHAILVPTFMPMDPLWAPTKPCEGAGGGGCEGVEGRRNGGGSEGLCQGVCEGVVRGGAEGPFFLSPEFDAH